MRICLNEAWRLHKTDLSRRAEELAQVRAEQGDWYDCSLPCDVRMPLMENGVIKDPVLADYCHDSEWIERCAWWYFKTFTFEERPEDYEAAELFLEAIDTGSDVFFNGVWIGSHANVHRPFCRDVKEYLRQGENEIAVRVTTGLESVSDADLAELEAQITACQTEQESCGSDYVKLQELQARQAELEAALEEKTERWVYLNELKEQIDAQNG